MSKPKSTVKKVTQGVVVLALAGLFLYGVSDEIPKLFPKALTAEQKAETAARIAPVGAVYVGAEGAVEAATAAAVAAAAASAQVAYGGTLDGKVIYDRLCSSCHATGSGGAPLLNGSGIGARMAQKGLEVLTKNATDGFTGSAGVMPARGGNPGLSDEQVQATVKWMVDNSK